MDYAVNAETRVLATASKRKPSVALPKGSSEVRRRSRGDTREM